MKVGDYVRTNYGIAKIVGSEAHDLIIHLDKEIMYDHIDYISSCTHDEIIKSSSNIIDLIEENDLVRIEYYAPSYEERITRIFIIDFKNENDIAFENSHCNLNIFDNEWSKHDIKLNPVIKGIITHEQIESMEYKVKE